MRVLEVFDSLQGEGVWAGVAMTFVRFAGCNASDLRLGCLAWCDTPQSWRADGGVETDSAQIVERVLRGGLGRVCLTGGEPLLQGEHLARLIERLQDAGVLVHVETNGTLPPPGATRPDWVTVSPKPPDYVIVGGLCGMVDELKVVVDQDFQVAWVEALAAEHPSAAVCLQPEASRLAETGKVAADAVLAHPGWRLSIQLHRVLGIP
ncbi:MAG: 7-carboxy-7-deazaguanine synthase QueE [Actinobacteria bacterium]|nr:7-carboxy-7-deazaguanine synthase QueE [Actinomycetota bacterium]